MTDHDKRADVIELGIASEVTRGTAIVQQDVSGGQQRFLPGIVDN